MADVLSQEIDITCANIKTELSYSEKECDVDSFNIDNQEKLENRNGFIDFDNTESGSKYDLEEGSTVLDFFSLFWGIEIIYFIIRKTNRYCLSLGVLHT